MVLQYFRISVSTFKAEKQPMEMCLEPCYHFLSGFVIILFYLKNGTIYNLHDAVCCQRAIFKKENFYNGFFLRWRL